MHPKTDVYIAAPFFNEPQNDLVDRIETLFDGHGITYFSPRKLGKQKIDSAETAREVFLADVVAIDECRFLLAVLDWILPSNQYTAVMKRSHSLETLARDSDAIPTQMEIRTTDQALCEINIPDAGTVFEMGYAYARKKPVIAYKHLDGGKLNIMLTQSTIGVLRGIHELKSWADSFPRKYTGGHQ